MENTTMTKSAFACVLSARPRPASTVLLAAINFEGQGSTLSIAKTTHVARPRSGRPPV